MYKSVKFFTNRRKDQSFIAWIGTVIHPFNVQEEEYIFKEQEPIVEMYFLVKGRATYVLPRFKNKEYFVIEQGSEFGHVDLFGRRYPIDQLIIENSKKKNDLIRNFTCRAEDTCELLNLPVSDLDRMHKEFPDIYVELY
jgi:CRP-like cAMP-binding protein